MMSAKYSFFSSLTHAIHGVREVWRSETNFRIEVIIGFLIIVFGFFLSLSAFEWIVIFIMIFIVLSTEILNSAVEKIVDVLLPRYGEKAHMLKDIMAGFVLISSLLSLLVGILIFGPKILEYLNYGT